MSQASELRDRILAPANMLGALEDVRRRDAADGILSRGALRFLADPILNIEELATSAADGSYAPRPLWHVAIPKPSGVRVTWRSHRSKIGFWKEPSAVS